MGVYRVDQAARVRLLSSWAGAADDDLGSLGILPNHLDGHLVTAVETQGRSLGHERIIAGDEVDQGRCACVESLQ